jgi:magnesium transporter
MVRLFHRVRKPPAQAPGTVAFVGEQKVERVSIKLIDYDATSLDERALEDFHETFTCRETDTVSWINVNGLHDTDLMREMGTHFGLHPLVLEDIVNTHQRPKMEDFGDYLYIVARMLSLDADRTGLVSEQISLVVGPNFLLSFQERPGDVLEPVRERLRRGKGRIRTAGPGYLGYALLDAVVDHYFHVLEGFGEAIEALEEELLGDPPAEALARIHHLKREMVLLRRAVWPLREIVTSLDRDEVRLMGAEVAPFLRDLRDHVVQVADTIDSFRDILSGLQDLYLSGISNRMNDIMKVLTIFASIFVPLTFVAGIYGMNFQFMPELAWRWSYPIFWGVILVLVGIMLVFFKRRKWL